VGFALVVAAIGIEFALVFVNPVQATLHEVVVHSVFIVLFALINLIFTRTEVARMRRYSARMVAQAKAAMMNDARAFRLTAPASGASGSLSREEEDTKISHSSMDALRNAVYHHIDLLKRTMDLHTIAVLWLDLTGKELRVLDCVTDSDNITRNPLSKDEGIIAAVLSNGKPLRIRSFRPDYPELTYYSKRPKVTDFVGVPIIEGQSVRGVLCADRDNGVAFDEKHIKILEASVESILNIVANERVFTQLQKSKSEQTKLLAASEALSKTLAEKDVVKASIDAARQIVGFDLALVALADSKGKQVIIEAVGPGANELKESPVSSSSSLAAAALKNRHFLPYRGTLDPRQQVVISKKTQKYFTKMRSAMVLPLFFGETPLGTLTLAAEADAAFGEEIRTTLQVMTNQLGTSLQNARMVRRLEELATTDGLTGLPNRRILQEELEKKLASAIRFESELSVILCDVDKFKRVNDIYGHPVGDIVLKGVADTLTRNVVRDTDMPSRYGGEEFAILCEGTGTKGAAQLADRIRRDLQRQIYHTDQGELRVTISMGVATYPSHASTKEELVEHADNALYAAKENGRNQVKTWRPEMSSK
jgi:diguanylate cyclase (GGDEF)-like protein